MTIHFVVLLLLVVSSSLSFILFLLPFDSVQAYIITDYVAKGFEILTQLAILTILYKLQTETYDEIK